MLDGTTLYESTGLEGRSSLRRVDLATGRVLQRADQPDPIFSEGLAVIGTRLIQLTWKNGIAYEYDKKTLQRTRELGYAGEGWGACFDGKSLVTSDGSDLLMYRDPSTLASRREVRVTTAGRSLAHLNELECVDGQRVGERVEHRYHRADRSAVRTSHRDGERNRSAVARPNARPPMC